MLHMSEQSDASCSKNTNASKLVINFIDEPLEKSDSEVVHLPPHEDFIEEN